MHTRSTRPAWQHPAGPLGRAADWSAFDLAGRIAREEVSAAAVVEECLEQAAALDSPYHAFVSLLGGEARAAARRADDDVRRGRPLGRLHGVPVTVKDAFLMDGTATSVGSVMLRDYRPARDEAACVQRLRAAGAVIVGKTNVGSGMSRAYWENTRLPPARNPWRLDRTPGGSSSGSAVSLALRMCAGSVGTDLGGSIRIPAAFSGVVGLKPTYGRVSQYGDIFGMGRALEHVGPLAATVRDAALLLEVLAGPDPHDPTSVDTPLPDLMAAVDLGMPSGIRIGWPPRGGPAGAEPDVLARTAEGVGVLAEAGAVVEEVDLPVCDSGVWDLLAVLDEWEAYDREVSESGADAEYLAYVRATLARRRAKAQEYLASLTARLRAGYALLFERFDLLALPTAPIVAKPLGMWTMPWNGKARETMDLHLANTWMFNVTGHPAISLPCGLDADGLPVGLELVGRPFQEDTLLAVAAAFERAVDGFPFPPAAVVSFDR